MIVVLPDPEGAENNIALRFTVYYFEVEHSDFPQSALHSKIFC